MKLTPLTLKEKKLLDEILAKEGRLLCSYSFITLWLWSAHFDIRWALIDGNLCIFFRNEAGCFMNIPPLGGLKRDTVMRCFEIMQGINDNLEVSRIENVEERDLDFFKQDCFRFFKKTQEYIVSREDISAYRGDRYKDKRNLCNFFQKNNIYKVRRYEDADCRQVLELFECWKQGRLKAERDDMYKYLLQDSSKVFSFMLKYLSELRITASVVEVKNKIAAFTCGYPVGNKTFCINFEIADLNYKGLAQFTFREFSRSLNEYEELNIMDDSGIEALKKTKLSFKPVKNIASFNVLMKS